VATKSTKRTTVADMIAAAKVGALDPSTEVVTVAEAASAAAAAAEEAATSTAAAHVPSGTEHECAIPGCRHGAAHGPTQPDRQIKLACPTCGAVARMTAAALAKSGGKPPICGGDGATFAAAARRVYSRRSA
jgi:hypothetical protein